jgi:Mg2+/Co2+ transporter CorB
MEIGLAFLVVLVLIVISGVFSAAETGVTAASKARIHRLAREGSKRAKLVEKLIEDKESLIGSALLGNNLVNTLAGSLTTYVLSKTFGGYGVIYATVVVTILVLIFAEVLPKTYAITRPDRVAITLGPVLGVVTRILNPIIRGVQAIVRFTLRLVGVDVSEDLSYLSSQEEVRGMIDLHATEGGLGREHQQQLGSILDMDEVTVEDVMIHRKKIEVIDADQPAQAIVRAVVRSSHTRLPLYRNDPDNIIGILHAKDVLRALSKRGAEPEYLKIDKLMTQPLFVPNTTTLREQLNTFTSRRQHFALVVDEYGALQGLVTLEDILEEIVGDITDEHDVSAAAGLTVNEDGSITVEGGVTIRDLNRRFNWNLPDEEASTIAGLVINEARIIPVKGQKFNFHGFRFDVLERRRNQITLLKMTSRPEPASESDVA